VVVVVFAPHTHAKKKRGGWIFCPFFVLFFCFGPDDVTRSIDRSISRKQKKEEKVPNNTNNTNTNNTNTNTNTIVVVTVLEPRNTQKEDARTKPPFREKNAEEKKTREEETKREVKRKRDERDGGEGWRRFWRDLEFDDDDDDDGTTTTTTTTLR